MKNNFYLIALLLFLLPVLSFSQDKIDVLILNKNYEQALSELDKKITKLPDAALYLKRGMIYENLQDYQNAVTAFTEGLMLEPENTTLMEETAECFAILGNNRDAVAFYEKAKDLAPDNLVLAGKLGRVYINEKQYQEAYDVFSSIYSRDSSNVFWNKQLAYCAFRVFKREEAVHIYEKVVEANPRDHSSYINLINSYNWKKEGNQIMVIIQKGLNQFPSDPDLLYEEAMYFFKTKQYAPAMVSFEKFRKVEPETDYETLMNIGIATYFAGFEKDALDIFDEMFTMNPNDPLVIYYQSLCYKKLNNYEEAEKRMIWAIEGSTPDYVAEMYHHLGQIYGQERKFAESVEALQKAYELNPEKIEVLFEIATTYEEFNSNKTLAMNYYSNYLKVAAGSGKNTIYALERIEKLKEDLFFEE